jgi:hypothetical protein
MASEMAATRENGPGDATTRTSHGDSTHNTESTVEFSSAADIYIVRFVYNPSLVELVKATVPPQARTWSRQLKLWIISALYAEELARVLRSEGHTVVGLAPKVTSDPAARTHGHGETRRRRCLA